MLNRQLKLLLFFTILTTHSISITIVFENPIKAVCVVPVCDLVGEAFEKLNPNVTPKEQYEKITISGESGKFNCIRIHQVLFNERVDILEELSQEVKIKISTVFYFGIHRTIPNCTYWTLKENFMPIETEQYKFIPKAIDFTLTNFDAPEQNIVTLILPFYDTTTQTTYSIGTRFVLKSKDDQSFTVLIYNSKTKSFQETKVNINLAIQPSQSTIAQKIQNFCNLLKFWTIIESKNIPYVWGGVSLYQFITNPNNFNLIPGKNCLGDDITYYKRDELKNIPYSGFDCSGLIARAAQICEIPYFFKNTHTIHPNLQVVDQNDEVKDGDLIWFQGHVIAIVDAKKGLCVEARGYSSGFGKVHQIHISKIFKNINTMDELKNAQINNLPVELINKMGDSVRQYKIKILKLESVWYWNKNNS